MGHMRHRYNLRVAQSVVSSETERLSTCEWSLIPADDRSKMWHFLCVCGPHYNKPNIHPHTLSCWDPAVWKLLFLTERPCLPFRWKCVSVCARVYVCVRTESVAGIIPAIMELKWRKHCLYQEQQQMRSSVSADTESIKYTTMYNYKYCINLIVLTL